jgi:hypothetical protein
LRRTTKINLRRHQVQMCVINATTYGGFWFDCTMFERANGAVCRFDDGYNLFQKELQLGEHFRIQLSE